MQNLKSLFQYSGLFLTGLLITNFSVLAQDTSLAIREKAVIQTIETLFDAMRAGDSAQLRVVIHPAAHLQTTFVNAEGIPTLRNGDINRWIESVGTPHEEVYDEKIWSYEVNIADQLASVWTEYTFYLGDKMSHCGVNAFHLVDLGGDWKISHITDTRRKDNCRTEMPDYQKEVQLLLDNWHQAAAEGDAATFFGSMSKDGYYIGTDASEKWLTDSMAVWAKPYFERGKAWDFTVLERAVYFDKNKKTGWFDEKLDTWMGLCRASGVVERTGSGWKIAHYHLSVTVPNEEIDAFLKIATPSDKLGKRG